MTDYQDAQLKMFLEVSNFFDENIDVFGKNSVLKKHITKLNQLITELKKYIKKQEVNTTGYAADKRKAKTKLSQTINKLSAIIRSYATDNNNDTLFNQFKLSLSSIKKLKDVEIVIYGKSLSETLDKNKTALKPYGLTAEDIAGLNSQIADYDKLLLLPAEMRKEKSVATAKIKSLIRDISNLLKLSIDNDMEQYKTTQADLYEKYQNIREIDDSKTTALSIKGKVTDTNGNILQNVKVVVKFKPGSDLSQDVKSTSAKGNFQFKGLPEGKYTVSFELDGYKPVTTEISVYHDKYTPLDVEMEKI